MDNIIPPLLIIFSLLGLVLLFNRNPQEITWSFKVLKNRAKGKREIFHWTLSWRDVRNTWLSFIEKFLIRLRIILLRLERVVHNNLRKIKEVKNGETTEEKFSFSSLPPEGNSQIEEQGTVPLTQKLITDLLLEEKKLLRKISKNPDDLDSIRNLAHLYLYEGDLSSACWIVVKGVLLNPRDKVLQGLMCELEEKKSEINKKTEKG